MEQFSSVLRQWEVNPHGVAIPQGGAVISELRELRDGASRLSGPHAHWVQCNLWSFSFEIVHTEEARIHVGSTPILCLLVIDSQLT